MWFNVPKGMAQDLLRWGKGNNPPPRTPRGWITRRLAPWWVPRAEYDAAVESLKVAHGLVAAHHISGEVRCPHCEERDGRPTPGYDGMVRGLARAVTVQGGNRA